MPSGPSRRLGVVTLVDGLGIAGGAERFARELTLRLDRDRFATTLCVTRWSDEVARSPAGVAALADLRRAGVEVLPLRRSSRLSLSAWRPLVARLRRGEVDVLHTHKFGSNVWGATLGAIAPPAVLIAHEQTWSYEGNPARRFLDRELIGRRADAFLCVSAEDRRRMIDLEGIDPEKVVLVHNAVPIVEGPSRAEARRRLGLDDRELVVGTVCVLRPQKALHVLLRAAALAQEELPSLRVLIAGDGPERARLELLAESLGLRGSVSFLGERDDVEAILPALDLAALSSDYEGTPLAVMEYMAAGLPIVATRVGGLPDLIEDGVEGRLVEPGDPPALARAIAEVARDPDAAAELGRRASARQRREFDISVAVRRVETLYERLHAGSARARGASG